MKISVQIKRDTPTAKLPTCGSPYSAGYDVYADIEKPVYIYPHTTEKISTGLKIAVSPDYWVGLFARSGLATKQGLRPANCIGVIDSDYRGLVIMAVHNDGNKPQCINPGDRIGQLIILPRYEWDITEVDELDDTARGEGGFGSTGK